MRRAYVLLWLLLSAMLLPTRAQTDTLTHLSPVDGRIDADTPEAIWTVSLREGAMVSFWAQPLESTFDPMLSVINANGDTLASSDDYDAPFKLDARIEGFSAPQTAQYRVVVRGAGGSTGSYRLHMLLGYSEIILWDNFGGTPNLALLNPSQSNPPRLTTLGGTLLFQQDGIQQTAIALHQNANAETFYLSATVKNISYRSGWQIGFVLRYQDADNYATVLLNHQRNWRFVQRQDGKDTILRDWTSHPAIIADKTSFRLDVLANGASFELLYDGQFVGSVLSPAPVRSGRIGFVITTANALDGTVAATFDDLILTVPTRRSDSTRLRPDVLVVGSANFMARQLVRYGLMPPQNEQAFTLAQSDAAYNLAGVSRVPLARGVLFDQLVFIATASWQGSTQGINGCGLTAHDNSETNSYLLAYVDSAGGHGISLRENDAFTRGFWGESSRSATRAHLTWIIQTSNTLLYVNGFFAGELAHSSSSGRIGNAVVNFDTLNTQCTFSDLSVWRWE